MTKRQPGFIYFGNRKTRIMTPQMRRKYINAGAAEAVESFETNIQAAVDLVGPGYAGKMLKIVAGIIAEAVATGEYPLDQAEIERRMLVHGFPTDD